MMENSLVVLKKKSLIEQVINLCLYFVTITAIIILTCCTIIIVKKVLYPQKVPDILGIKPFIVLTGSMEPEIKPGDIAIIQTIDPAKLVVGDIVAFRYTKDDEILLHRITEINTNDNYTSFRTKGDNNEAEDRLSISYENIEGIYTNNLRGIGKIAMVIKTPSGTICAWLSILVICLIWQITKIKKKERILGRRLKECQEVIEEIRKDVK